jgi:O-antigen/teichoic acid export membrane protein
MLEMILQSIDRIMIAKYLGLKALGFYSVALMSRNYSEGVSKNFNVVITPHFLEDYGKTGNITTASKYLKTTAELMSSFMAYLLGLVYIVAPIFVVYVLPDFTQGIAALKYMLLTTFFYTASPQSQHFLIAMNKQSRLIPIACFAIVINIIFNLIFLKHGFGITGVAAATTIASLVVFLISLLYALMHIENITKALKFSILIMSPLFYSAVILLAMEKMRFINPFLEIFIKGALFTLLFLPWVYRINKKTAILNTLKVIIAEKLTQNSFIKKQNDK